MRLPEFLTELSPVRETLTVLPTADLTAHRWEAVTGGVMMEVWG